MATWIGLLRGINVGGKNKLKMAELREALTKAGLEDVQTYIQSGNLVFKSGKKAAELEAMIREVIAEGWDYDVPTMVFKSTELKKWFSANPFLGDEAFLHLTVLAKKPTAANVKVVESIDFGSDQISITGRCAYIVCPSGYSKTKLTNGLMESKLNVRATTRNWRTVSKLLEMCSA